MGVTEEEEQTGGGPERVFEELKREVSAVWAEVAVTRRAVEALPDAWADNRPPDYKPELGRIARDLATVAEHLEAIERHPALEMTPETHAARITNAGLSVTREAERAFQKASIEATQTTRHLSEMIGQMRGRKAQREKVFFWTGIAGLSMLVLGLVGSPFLANYLPFGWDSSIASIVMGQPDRWDAGTALMRAANPTGWNNLVDTWNIMKLNQKELAACNDEAAKTKKDRRCTITVATPKQQ